MKVLLLLTALLAAGVAAAASALADNAGDGNSAKTFTGRFTAPRPSEPDAHHRARFDQGPRGNGCGWPSTSRKPEVFSWENVSYCNDPLSSCQ